MNEADSVSAGAAQAPAITCGRLSRWTQHVSTALTRWTGTSVAFLIAVSMIAIWLLSGPLFGFTDTWQLVMNTATSVITFLMVFLIQRTQNKDSLAIQLKLNEIVAALNGASNRMIDVEDLSEEELRQLHGRYQRLAKRVGDSVESIRTSGEPGLEVEGLAPNADAAHAADAPEAAHAGPPAPAASQPSLTVLGPIDRLIAPRRRDAAIRSVKPVVPAARRKRETREMP